jgi:hypothetical protein
VRLGGENVTYFARYLHFHLVKEDMSVSREVSNCWKISFM